MWSATGDPVFVGADEAQQFADGPLIACVPAILTGADRAVRADEEVGGQAQLAMAWTQWWRWRLALKCTPRVGHHAAYCAAPDPGIDNGTGRHEACTSRRGA